MRTVGNEISTGDPVVSRPGFRPDIEGLRAVAILLVLLYHAKVPGFAGGFVGVDIFFVLSGFLITGTLLREAERSGRIRLGEFYARRIRRLLPASVLVLGLTAVAVRLLLPSTMWRAFAGDITASAAYLVNWRLADRAVDYLAQDVTPSPVQHFWSLAIEEQFYVVWPLLLVATLWLSRRLGLRLRPALTGALVGVILVPSLAWSVRATATDPAAAFFSTGTRLWEMALGSLVAVVGTRLAWRSTRVASVVRIGAMVGLLAFAGWLDGSAAWPGWVAAVPTGLTAFLIWSGGSQDRLDRALSMRPMQALGAWSYSLYLWHWPPVAILGARWGSLDVWTAVLIVALSAIPAVIAYRWWESPMRFHPTLRASTPFSLTVGATLTLTGVVAGLSLALMVPSAPPTAAAGPGARVLADAPTVDDLLSQIDGRVSFTPIPELAVEDRPAVADERCQARRADVEPIVCERGLVTSRTTVMVVGDSKAAQWDAALDAAGHRFGWRILMVIKSACELTLTEANWAEEPYPECRQWSERVIDLVAEERPVLVITSQVSSDGWVSEEHPTDPDVIVEGMLAAYAEVEALGAQVVMLEDNPPPTLPVRDCVAEHRESLAECAFPSGERMAGARAQRRVADEGGFALLSMNDQICPHDLCLPVIGGILLYRDGSHLTDSYVESMADVLTERLGATVGT